MPLARPARRHRRALTAAAAAAALLPAVGVLPQAHAAQAPDGGSPAAPAAADRQGAYRAAAERYGVPEEVLLAVSYLESRWDTHAGLPSTDAGYGPMHLTDAPAALASLPRQAGDGAGDPRGDDARPFTAAAPVPAVPAAVPARLRTAERAAALTGLPAQTLRTDPAANIAGGAALLADLQRGLHRAPSADPADWYGAVAGYAGDDDPAAAGRFADDVYDVLRSGAARTTDDGQPVALAATRVRAVGTPAHSDPRTECPHDLGCAWLPAPYQQLSDNPTDYGNHDVADRPATEHVDYIVVHDTEASWDTTLKLVQDPSYLGWHYSVRSADGQVDQHIATKDIGWHAGNWDVNARSVGIEHEGFLAAGGTWYTEAMYRSSARLVRYLAHRYDIPLDRQHVLGHDNVPGPTAATTAGMHLDPGPYWDWAHYFALLGRPLHPTAGPRSGLVEILPDYAANRPAYTGCTAPGEPCPPQGSSAVTLHTAPADDAPLVTDIGRSANPATDDVYDMGARASTGQRYAVAGRQGDWTAVWYLGQRAWFHDPADRPAEVPVRGDVVTPRAGLADIPVYGRAYPEAGAYPAGVPVQPVSPLKYRLPAGQSYAVGGSFPGQYTWSTTFDPSTHRVVTGTTRYYQIQFGHRIAFVKADDVDLVRLRDAG
ncbi:N-acetylmuramoyl-L-alanine amidase [Streptacidiphilus sp. ASG 303]|uniref:peptidoglycan recognition protein family protein n=1 Tax=Streptacidiphilus sp. ASG 303 TaxID=2896847 RepID=UPI001E586C56|nr:peptidoglycan recognition family protein [Streptacidiphilus sp. ASG 303]MCD0484399.1 N-acetylmuramoyl-L-alanine amidase [Streptacidiphilus sp. ASG 303]